MINNTAAVDPVAVVRNYELRNMSAKVGMLAGSLCMFRALGLNEPEWAESGLKSILSLEPVDKPDVVIEKAFSGFERFLQTCALKNGGVKRVGWDYNLGI